MKPKRRRLPPTAYPLGAELDYSRALRSLFAAWWNETVIEIGKALNHDDLAPAGSWRKDVAAEDVFKAAKAKWGDKVERFRPTIEKAAAAVDRTARISLANQIKAAAGTPGKQSPKEVAQGLGIELFQAEPEIVGAVAVWTAENIRLIKSIGDDAATRMEGLVKDWAGQGRLTRNLVDELQEEYKFDRKRAKVIARDQIGKLNGRINQVRQESVGVTHYTWHSMQDGRVRKAHAEREGQVFAWNNPPPDGHPGHPVCCRCTSTPVFDKAKDLGLTAEEIALEASEDEARAARRRAQVAARQASSKAFKEAQAERQKAEAKKLSPAYPLEKKAKGPHKSTIGNDPTPGGFRIPEKPKAFSQSPIQPPKPAKSAGAGGQFQAPIKAFQPDSTRHFDDLNTHQKQVFNHASAQRGLARKKQTELAIAWTEEGEVARAQGKADHVSFKENASKLPGTRVTHNHPIPTSFSGQDLETTITHHLAGSEVLTEHNGQWYLFEAIPPRSIDLSEKTNLVDGVKVRVKDLVTTHFESLTQAGMDFDSVNLWATDLAMREISPEYGVKYKVYHIEGVPE